MKNESACRLWALPDPLLTVYHDEEWCHVSHDDRYIFEMICLEGQSVGLSWRTIVNKRQAYKAAFFNFDIDRCAQMSDEELDRCLENTDLIRSQKKIYSIRQNARVVKQIIATHGSLDAYIWSFTDGKTIAGHWETMADIPTQTALSQQMSKALKKLGMAFVGPVITYSFMQSIGMVNDHLLDCPYR